MSLLCKNNSDKMMLIAVILAGKINLLNKLIS